MPVTSQHADDEGHVHLTQAERSSTVFVSALSVVLALAAAAALLIGTRWLRHRSAQRRPCPECGIYYQPETDAVCPSCGHRFPTPRM
jgi:hypothetical protein